MRLLIDRYYVSFCVSCFALLSPFISISVAYFRSLSKKIYLN